MKKITSAIAVLTAVLLTSCKTSTPTYTYMFSPVTECAAPAKCSVTLTQLRLAPYLERNEMVYRVSNNEIKFRDNRKWAESLYNMIKYWLGQELYVRSNMTADNSYRASVSIERFETDNSNVLHLNAICKLNDTKNSITKQKKFKYSFNWDGNDYNALVALYDKAIIDFANDIMLFADENRAQ